MRGRPCWTVAAVALGTLSLAGTASAATFEVTRGGDPNPGDCRPRDCSLREAVLAANARMGADEIVLPGRRYELSQANPGGVPEDVGIDGDLDVNTDPLSFIHPGRGRATIDANGIDRVLHVQEGAPTRLVKIAVTGGELAPTEDGGGILTDADLSLRSGVVRGNSGEDGGGIDLDGTADLKLSRSVVRSNQADVNDDSNGGGVNSATAGSELRVVRSKVLDNRALGDGGGIAVTDSGVTVVVARSTIGGNRAAVNGGGINVDGDADLGIANSTLSGNRAEEGGGLRIGFGAAAIRNSTLAENRARSFGGGIRSIDGAEVTLNAVTIARNRAASDDAGLILIGGGGFASADTTFTVRNSLIALNTIGAAAASRNDCVNDNPADSLGNNLLSTTDGQCDGFDEPSDLVRPNPKLGELARNGGPTETVALKRRSPAIGSAHRPSAPNRDQRGRERDRNPDIGAFERGA